ncbi:hypothetical protein QNA08_08930 [Chelatococcus sp. SYSU_G07232]|uniref:Nitrate reductase n=1 Tax=Chelatococcus albus TaxID=3047466 RepID=A0ABT7AG54_9HYPH|nr:hypothetical protein [Chelatococcus sp. SYSU_G07232]MDJ1158355.1 hypothetical protein [Chelatococcus sp. SYSU_G07232]
MARFGLFRASRPKGDTAALGRVKIWVRDALALPEDVALAVNEIVCADPACPGLETVVLVMEPGKRTRAIKFAKGAEDVTREDVEVAVADGVE